MTATATIALAQTATALRCFAKLVVLSSMLLQPLEPLVCNESKLGPQHSWSRLNELLKTNGFVTYA